jgi:spore maturation protein CgeB
MKRVLVEGSKWMGCWVEFTVEGLEELGFDVDVIYSNHKNVPLKLASMLGKTGLWDAKRHLASYYCQEVLARLKSTSYDYYFSVSGKLDGATLRDIRTAGIRTRIIYWIGDRFVDHVKDKFDNLYQHHELIDGFAFAEPGVYKRLIDKGFKKIYYLPFGISKRFHRPLEITDEDRVRFGYDVSFVSTWTPRREEMVRYLNRELDEPVALWGRGWQGTGIPCRGRLALEEVMKVYAFSKISLNLHQDGVEGGNMRYFEIPAVGGFQLCDWKENLPREDFGNRVQTFKDLEDLKQKIKYFLTHENERQLLSHELQNICQSKCTYKKRFNNLFASMEKIGS